MERTKSHRHLTIDNPPLPISLDLSSSNPPTVTPSISPQNPIYDINSSFTTTLSPRSSLNSSNKWNRKFQFPSVVIGRSDDDDEDEQSDTEFETEYNSDESATELVTEYSDSEDKQEEDNEEDYYPITVTGDCGKQFQFEVQKFCTIYSVRNLMDQNSDDFPLNKSRIYFNSLQCKDHETLDALKVRSGGILVISCDPIYWDVDEVTNFLVNLGYDEFSEDYWTHQRIDGAELLLNIRGGHLRYDALIEDENDIKHIMSEIRFLRKKSLGWWKEINNRLRTENKYQKHEIEKLNQLIIQNNIINVKQRKEEINEYNIREKKLKHEMKKLEKSLRKQNKKFNKLKLKLENEMRRKVIKGKKVLNKCKQMCEINGNKINKCKQICDYKRNDLKNTERDMNNTITSNINGIGNEMSSICFNVEMYNYKGNDVKNSETNINHCKRKQKKRRRSFVANKLLILDNEFEYDMYDYEDAYAFGHDGGKIC